MGNIFKNVIDRMEWVQVPAAPNAHASAACMCADLRSDKSRNPFTYQLASATVLNRYNIITKSWSFVQSPALAGTFGPGAAIDFVPSFGLVGVLAAGATTTKVVIGTAFPTSVGMNMLANRGGSSDFGFKLRIIDTVAGKTEERWIVANTASTTPTIWVDGAFTFTPATGARYEILGGRVFMLGAGTTAANIWRSFEVASNTLSTGLTTTNLPATIGTDTSINVLDEQYTPYDMNPGEGMIKGAYKYDSGTVSDRYALVATAANATTLTGQATGGDAVIAANEYRNFQLRVVEDTTTPAAVGQRMIIASHTAGPSPVYTVYRGAGAGFATTPSANAKYVIELPNLLLMRSTATTSVYTYNYTDGIINNGTATIAAGAWSVTYFGVAGAANGSGGVWAPGWGYQPDVGRNARHSFQYFFRAGGASALDILDIAGGVAGSWTASAAYDGALAIGTGTSLAHSPFGNEGRMCYMNIYVASATNQMYRFDTKNRVLSPYTPTDLIQAGTAAVGNRMAAYVAIDGTDGTHYDVVLLLSHLSTLSQELIPLV